MAAHRWLPQASGMRTRLDGSGDGVRARALLRQPGRDGGDVGVGQARGDALHAVGLGGVAFADAPARRAGRRCRSGAGRPGRECRAPCRSGSAPWQAMQAGMPLAGSPAVASAWPRCVRPRHRRAAALRGANGGRSCGEVLGDLLQVGVGQVGDQVVHRRIAARAVAERDQLVVAGSRPACRRCAGSSRCRCPGRFWPWQVTQPWTRASIESSFLKAGTASGLTRLGLGRGNALRTSKRGPAGSDRARVVRGRLQTESSNPPFSVSLPGSTENCYTLSG